MTPRRQLERARRWAAIQLPALLIAGVMLADPAAAAEPRAGGAGDPTVAVFEVYYGTKVQLKTPEYARLVDKQIVKLGGFDVVSFEDAERIVKKTFPVTKEMKLKDVADQIRKLVKEAEDDFFNGDLVAAQAKLRRANGMLEELVQQRQLVEEVKREYISTQMLLALLYLKSGEEGDAQEVIDHLIRQVGNDGSISTDNYHPDVVNKFRQRWQALREKRIGKVMVRTNPPGADVYINGLKQQRKSPATYEDLYTGEITVQARKGEKASRIHRIDVSTGAVQEVRIDLSFEHALAFSTKQFGLKFDNDLDRKRNLPIFGAKIGDMVDADYVAFVGLGEEGGDTFLEGYLVHAETDKLVRHVKMRARANVVSKRRVVEMARFIVYGDQPAVIYKPWYTNTVGWVLTGVGVVGGALGAVFYTSYQSDRDIAECDPTATTCEKDEAGRLDAKDSAETSRALAYASWGIGGASLIGGVLAFILMEEEDLDAETRANVPGTGPAKQSMIQPIITPDGGMGIGATFTF